MGQASFVVPLKWGGLYYVKYVGTEATNQNTPCSIMASATRLKPAILAPATKL